MASSLNGNGLTGMVYISEDTYYFVKDSPQFFFGANAKIDAKEKGEITMYFVSKAR